MPSDVAATSATTPMTAVAVSLHQTRTAFVLGTDPRPHEGLDWKEGKYTPQEIADDIMNRLNRVEKWMKRAMNYGAPSICSLLNEIDNMCNEIEEEARAHGFFGEEHPVRARVMAVREQRLQALYDLDLL